ncbi:hypothetical protein LTR66_008889 [Elasticomyces elasticus]|nr:hypothetical protein LTR66_008889 [Elasticomyces elasticus]
MPALRDLTLRALALSNVKSSTSNSSSSQNSLSVLGTGSLNLPAFLTNNPLPQGYPWGSKTALNANPYVDSPDTGITRHYDLVIAKGTIAPDGVEMTGITCNGQFPCPLIEANWGDWIEVTVTNNIPTEGTSVHWHGFLQQQTPWMDGVPGVGQCPIAPGSSFTYRFKATLYGSSWYHSHYSSQYGSGLVGPIVVYGPKNADYDLDVGPVMLGDWYHTYYEQAVAGIMKPIPHDTTPRSVNNLINGRNSFDCSKTSQPCKPNAGIATLNFTSGKTHRLRLANHGAAGTQKFSIDGHTMTVMANDFVPIVPYDTNVVTLSVGQRTDVLVKANKNSRTAVYMRAHIPPSCAPTDGGNTALGAIYYEDADTSKAPTSSPQSGWDNSYCGNDALSKTVPYFAIAAGTPSFTENIVVRFGSNGTHRLWYQNDQTFRINYNDPALLEVKLGETIPKIQSVHDYGSNKSVRFVIENHSGEAHPMHLHGHNIFVVAEARGGWDGKTVHVENPQRRDVQQMLPGGYVVLQWFQDNPGVWPLHCHIAWHISTGYLWHVLERPADIVNNMQIPSIMAQTCRDWAAWTGQHVVNQIDSGL